MNIDDAKEPGGRKEGPQEASGQYAHITTQDDEVGGIIMLRKKRQKRFFMFSLFQALGRKHMGSQTFTPGYIQHTGIGIIADHTANARIQSPGPSTVGNGLHIGAAPGGEKHYVD